MEVRAILDEPCRGYRTTAPSNVPGSHRKSKSHTTFTNTRHHPICIRRLLFDRGAWMTNVSVLQASSNKIGGVAHLQPRQRTPHPSRKPQRCAVLHCGMAAAPLCLVLWAWVLIMVLSGTSASTWWVQGYAVNGYCVHGCRGASNACSHTRHRSIAARSCPRPCVSMTRPQSVHVWGRVHRNCTFAATTPSRQLHIYSYCNVATTTYLL